MKIEKLYPAYKDYLWGGSKLKEKYGKQTDTDPLAESWELSFHKDGLTRISDGRTLAEAVCKKDLGENAEKFEFFAVLNKFIDAKQNLSVQVHPSDGYALKNEGSYGKTEMWYIVDAEEGAGIYLGFKKSVTAKEVQLAIEENRLTELLNFYSVKAGESYFIPSGTVHAIGAGCLIYEIQQNSNLTYRVYDYGRKDKNGKERELHVEKALKVADFKKYEKSVFGTGILGECEYFRVTEKVVGGKEIFFSDNKSFRCITCVSGDGYIEEQKITQGDSFFVPANYGEYVLNGKMKLIFTEIGQ